MNILTLGDFNFTGNMYTNLNNDVDWIYSIMSCHLKKRIERKLKILAKKNKRKIKLFEHKKMKKFEFFDKIDWNSIPPLSQKLIYDMSFCQNETMKMLERIRCIEPKLYENRYNHYFKSLRYFNYMLDKLSIDVFVRYSVPHMGYDNVLHHLCKLKGIKTYCVYFIHPYFGYFMEDLNKPLKNFKYISNRPFKFEKIEKLFSEYWNKEKLTYKPVTVPNVGRASKIQDKRKITKKELINYYNYKANKNPKLNKKYIYVALHFQHEATTCPLGGVFVNQHLMLDILSNIDIPIYVKEHPRISSNRNIDYYNRILKLKNTCLIPIDFDNDSLIENAFAIATVTGTAGWEATLKGKPCLAFGNIHYQYAPYCFRVSSLEEVIEAIKKIKTLNIEKCEIEKYLKGLEEYLFPLNHKSISIEFNKKLNELKNLNYEVLEIKNTHDEIENNLKII